jgi:uncharacterized protein (DUF488 family)
MPEKSISRLHLMKCLFLLKKEEHMDAHGSFYDFLPYQYGPFSFTVYKDLSDLERTGLIELKDKQVCLGASGNINQKLSKEVVSSIIRTIEEYGGLSQEVLIEYVYERYPWYASRSKLKPSVLPPVEQTPVAVYTLGYEGLSIDTFLNILLLKGIKRVIDVRNVAFSHKYGFSKTTLEQKCPDTDIGYSHFPQVGIPSETRNETSGRPELWVKYTGNILPGALDTVAVIQQLCLQEPSVLLCFEKDPYTCHRHLLARYVATEVSLPVIHYKTENDKWQRE